MKKSKKGYRIKIYFRTRESRDQGSDFLSEETIQKLVEAEIERLNC